MSQAVKFVEAHMTVALDAYAAATGLADHRVVRNDMRYIRDKLQALFDDLCDRAGRNTADVAMVAAAPAPAPKPVAVVAAAAAPVAAAAVPASPQKPVAPKPAAAAAAAAPAEAKRKPVSKPATAAAKPAAKPAPKPAAAAAAAAAAPAKTEAKPEAKPTKSAAAAAAAAADATLSDDDEKPLSARRKGTTRRAGLTEEECEARIAELEESGKSRALSTVERNEMARVRHRRSKLKWKRKAEEAHSDSEDPAAEADAAAAAPPAKKRRLQKKIDVEDEDEELTEDLKGFVVDDSARLKDVLKRTYKLKGTGNPFKVSGDCGVCGKTFDGMRLCGVCLAFGVCDGCYEEHRDSAACRKTVAANPRKRCEKFMAHAFHATDNGLQVPKFAHEIITVSPKVAGHCDFCDQPGDLRECPLCNCKVACADDACVQSHGISAVCLAAHYNVRSKALDHLKIAAKRDQLMTLDEKAGAPPVFVPAPAPAAAAAAAPASEPAAAAAVAAPVAAAAAAAPESVATAEEFRRFLASKKNKKAAAPAAASASAAAAV